MDANCKKGHHDEKDGRAPGTKRCRRCSWQFPCAGNGCGHVDCIEFRGKLPNCHHCGKQVTGHAAGVRYPQSPIAELRDWDDDGTWGFETIHGVTRVTHYECRFVKEAADADEALNDEGGVAEVEAALDSIQVPS